MFAKLNGKLKFSQNKNLAKKTQISYKELKTQLFFKSGA